VRKLAVYVLLIVATRNYAWEWFEPAQRGAVSKALGAAAILSLLILLYRAVPSKALGLVMLYGSFEELQTAICSIMYAIEPWEVQLGQAICSAKVGFELSAIGVMLCAATLHKVCQYVDLAGSKNTKKVHHE
jgi:hypothetical protein